MSTLIRMIKTSLIGLVSTILLVLATGCNSPEAVPQSNNLDATSWRLIAWSVPDLNPNDFEITLEISDDGVSGKSAVNRYFGPLNASKDGSFKVGMLGSTMMAGPEPAMRAEQEYLRLLPEARRWTIVSDELRLFAENGLQILAFRRVQRRALRVGLSCW